MSKTIEIKKKPAAPWYIAGAVWVVGALALPIYELWALGLTAVVSVAALAAAFRLSRAESARLFEAERVFVNGLPARSSSAKPEPGDIVSVRGMGRFRFEGALGETRRGRLRVSLRIYGR